MSNIIIHKISDKVFTIEEITDFIDSKTNDPGTGYLILKQLSSDESNFSIMENILSLLIEQKNIKWRHLKLCLPLYKKKDRIEFFEYYKKNIFPLIPIEEKLIVGIAKIYPELLDVYLNEYLIINEDFDDELPDVTKVDYKFLTKQIESFIKKKFSQRGLTAFLKVFPKKKYDLVFDGNNILLNKKGVIEIESFWKMVHLFESATKSGYNPVVFIHARHLKTLKRMGLKVPFAFVSTLYRYNDDWFSLYYAIKNNVHLVSRDIFRDHVNQFDTQKKSNFLKIFLHSRKLNIKEDFSEIIFEQKNIPIIIKQKGNYYLPGRMGYLKI